MKFISHRGNLVGREPEKENLPSRIEECLDLGLDVEVDVWRVGEKFYLGHDKPDHEIDIEFLKKAGLWCHAKNYQALETMLLDSRIHYFWHQEDDYTITSQGFPWVYPGKRLLINSVCVMPERADYADEEIDSCYGICSDYILEHKSNLLKRGRND